MSNLCCKLSLKSGVRKLSFMFSKLDPKLRGYTYVFPL